MPHQRLYQLALLLGLCLFSWLAMMLVHELGHVLAAWSSGGTVQRVVWHPFSFSRTDVSPNPAPLLVVWAGPVVGVVLPLVLERAAAVLRLPIAYMFTFFAGFCLIANGVYIGSGVIEPVGDAADMLQLGTPRWVMLLFALATVPAGLWLWHIISPHLGLGGKRSARPIPAKHACAALLAGGVLTAIALAVDFALATGRR